MGREYPHRSPCVGLGQGRTCRDTCQGQEPDTAFCPLMILSLYCTEGLIRGTPQPKEGHGRGSGLVPACCSHSCPVLPSSGLPHPNTTGHGAEGRGHLPGVGLT